MTAAICLINPKFPHNVGMVVRNASCFGADAVIWTGERVEPVGDGKKYRLPREERFKGYAEVDMLRTQRPFDDYPDLTPVAVEVRECAESLPFFEHPENAMYVFGPEDGGLTRATLLHCHRVLTIPSRHCLNLSVSTALVLYDRMLKSGVELPAPGLVEQRGMAS